MTITSVQNITNNVHELNSKNIEENMIDDISKSNNISMDTPSLLDTRIGDVIKMEVPNYVRKNNSPYEIYKENSSGFRLETFKRV